MSAAYGLMAGFASPETFTRAVLRVRQEGYTRCETFTPFPIPEAAEPPGRRFSPVAKAMLIGGLLSGAGAYLMMFYATHIYPIDVGGRPLNSWPSFIPITFELTVLGSALTGVAAFFCLAGFPRLDHPVFNDPRFVRCSVDRFFLCIRSDDPKYAGAATRRLLEALGPESVEEVEP